MESGQSELAHADFLRELDIENHQIQAHPESALHYYNRATTFIQLADYGHALADFTRAHELDPADPDAEQGRGYMLFRNGQYRDAIAAFDAAMALAVRRPRGNDPTLLSAACDARAAAGLDLEAARALCDSAVHAAGDADAYASRGYLQFMRGELADAKQSFLEARNRNNNHASANYGLGVVEVRLGQSEQGEADMARGRSLNARNISFYADAGLRP
ncbi:MAG: hypothetical protein WAU68_03575 [Vitreimonas sp.]